MKDNKDEMSSTHLSELKKLIRLESVKTTTKIDEEHKKDVDKQRKTVLSSALAVKLANDLRELFRKGKKIGVAFHSLYEGDFIYYHEKGQGVVFGTASDLEKKINANRLKKIKKVKDLEDNILSDLILKNLPLDVVKSFNKFKTELSKI